jgi:AmmeMemoRadiSam system protein A
MTTSARSPVALSESERRVLLALARQAVVGVVMGGDSSIAASRESATPTGALVEPGAAFVTLFVGGELRGCIGTADRARPLHRVVSEMARAAATRDWRFAALSATDLPSLTIEISVLGPEHAVHEPREIEIGRHGLDIRIGHARGLLLPQVAQEHGFDGERFLAETCRKAGLPVDAWQDPEADIRVFEADVFGDGAA